LDIIPPEEKVSSEIEGVGVDSKQAEGVGVESKEDDSLPPLPTAITPTPVYSTGKGEKGCCCSFFPIWIYNDTYNMKYRYKLIPPYRSRSMG
jgi:hypothetical protein